MLLSRGLRWHGVDDGHRRSWRDTERGDFVHDAGVVRRRGIEKDRVLTELFNLLGCERGPLPVDLFSAAVLALLSESRRRLVAFQSGPRRRSVRLSRWSARRRPRRSPSSRGTGSSNPSPSSGESLANLTDVSTRVIAGRRRRPQSPAR